MANLATNVPLVNDQFVDPQTGRITEAWFLFLIQLWRRTGGNTPVTPGISIDDVFAVEETFGIVAPDSLKESLGVEMQMAVPSRQEAFPEMIFAPVSLTTATVGNGTITDQSFSSGTDFTPGVTTSLTLSTTFLNASQIWVFFDGTFQGDDQYSLSGTTLTFTSAIPVGVSKVYVKGLR